MAKLLPYGITDYKLVATGGYYYVDKTWGIELIEQAPRFLFLIRPRRFGKSLFLNMLAAYYDIERRDEFDELFGDKHAGKYPTRERNTYMVLRFNFSEVRPDPETLAESLNEYCDWRYQEFSRRYSKYFEEDFVQNVQARPTANDKLDYIATRARELGLSIYLMIDEYDNFTNTILAEHGTKTYRELTHGVGVYRYFFNKLKGLTTENDASIKRMFITGVSPVTMDDVTSGFNIGSNITTDQEFNTIVGFSEPELRDMLEYYQAEGKLAGTIDEVVTMMKPWYDNYCFSNKCIGETMFNSDMVLYFLNYYLRYGNAPEDMLDRNIRTDYNKLRHLITVDQQLNGNFSMIRHIVETGEVIARLVDGFPAEQIANRENFVSLLYYFGLLSIDRVERGDTILRIPNLAVREQMYTYLMEGFSRTGVFRLEFWRLGELMKIMAFDGKWRPVFEFLAAEVDKQTTIREYIEGEALLKGFMQPYLGCSNYFIMRPEYELNKGYADFYLQPNLLQLPDMQYSYLIEVKYCKRGESDAAVEAKVAEGTDQLRHYSGDPLVESTRGTTILRRILVVWRGWEIVRMEQVSDEYHI